MRPLVTSLRLASWGVAAVTAVAGVVVWWLPVSVSVPPLAPAAIEAPVTAPPAVPTDAAEEMVLTNLFAAGRTPPATRYLPPELAMDTAGGMASAPDVPPMFPDSAMLAGDVPRLLGTVVAPGGPRALLHLSLASGPRLYAVGDREGGYTVVSVAPREVVLRGPGGRRTLRLDPEE
jgi:hypothetical protein